MIPAFQCVAFLTALPPALVLSGLPPVVRGALIAVFGIGTWVVGLLIAYLLYRRYVGRGNDREGERADDVENARSK